MAEPALRQGMTHEEFLALEAESEFRHAFHGGEMYSMAGGTRMHGTVGTAFLTSLALRLRVRGCGCFAHGPDVRLTPRPGDSMYPDVSVACAPVVAPAWDPEAIANPVAVVEVLSPTTADWDRGGKFELYQLFPTLRHYLVAHADAWRAQHRERMDDGSWRLTEHGPDEVIRLSALGIELPVNEIYEPLLILGGPARDARPIEKPRFPRT
jgi:Uma2 family endonuclease